MHLFIYRIHHYHHHHARPRRSFYLEPKKSKCKRDPSLTRSRWLYSTLMCMWLPRAIAVRPSSGRSLKRPLKNDHPMKQLTLVRLLASVLCVPSSFWTYFLRATSAFVFLIGFDRHWTHDGWWHIEVFQSKTWFKQPRLNTVGLDVLKPIRNWQVVIIASYRNFSMSLH